MEKTKLSFEVDVSQIDIKPILRKDFLELSMKAISSANPNRNNSWFTEESMERSKGSFINKPILGYFENGDFVSHNGTWNHDNETQMDYWDTLGKQGERILGTIRESDEVKIIKDKKGLSWMTFTCVLWTQYSFKQVKRLIKDAKRAAKEGGSAKNISVEVDITDYDMMPNGVMKINEFNLVGVTILGSRNGVKVEPGIEDAELSVVDIMGREVYEKQQQALRLAYERLDDSEKNKEEFQVEDTEVKTEEAIVADPVNENSDGVESANFEKEEPISEKREDCEEKCPECGKNPCECEKQCEEEKPAEEQTVCEESKCEESKCEEEQPVCEEAKCEEHPEEEKPEGDEPEEEDDDDEEEEDEGDKKEDCACGKEFEELKAKFAELTEKYEALEAEYAVIKEKYDLRGDYDEIKSKLSAYEHKDFMEQAEALIDSAKLDETVSAQFHKDCDEGTIASIADLKVKVALAAFDSHIKVEETTTLVAPVSNPDTTAAFAGKAEKTSGKSDCWSRLHDYTGK